jgi:hypothetical protein
VVGEKINGTASFEIDQDRAVSRRVTPARDPQVETSHFEKGNIRPTGLPAAVPRKEACDGEYAQDGVCRVNFYRHVRNVGRSGELLASCRSTGRQYVNTCGNSRAGQNQPCADWLERLKTSQFAGPAGSRPKTSHEPADRLDRCADWRIGRFGTRPPGPQSLCEPHREIILAKLQQDLSATGIWQDLVAGRCETRLRQRVEGRYRRRQAPHGVPLRSTRPLPGLDQRRSIRRAKWANHDHYPWGRSRGTPADRFAARSPTTQNERDTFQAAVILCERQLRHERSTTDQQLTNTCSALVHRELFSPRCRRARRLDITRRSIPQPIHTAKCARIT